MKQRHPMRACRGARSRAFLAVELAICLFVLATLSGLAVTAVRSYRTAQQHYAWRQAAAWAAEAQVQRLQAGAAYDTLPPAGLLPPEIQLETHVEPGRDQWTDFDRVEIVARVERPREKPIAESVRAYLPRKVAP